MLTEESLQKQLHKYLSKVKLAMKSKNYWIGMIISFLLFNIQGLTCYAANNQTQVTSRMSEFGKCKANRTQLSIFTKNDFLFEDNNCKNNDDESYIEEYLMNSDLRIHLYKKTDDGFYESPKVKAVSIYRPYNNIKPPILIVLHSQYNCCYPRPTGTLYNVNLFEIKKTNNAINVEEVTSILGKQSWGFEGRDSENNKTTYKFRDIYSIKNWLKNNYK